MSAADEWLSEWDRTAASRPIVMGILNVTPNSFSDGGRYEQFDSALARGRRLAEQGADVVDVGGESTGPGAHEVDANCEQSRVLPVIEALARDGIVVSVDTRRADTAALALDAGAVMVNDVSGWSVSDEMIALVSQRRVPYILTHRRGDPYTMDSLATYTDVAGEVAQELKTMVNRFLAAGMDRRRLIVDPGLGFAKNAGQNWQLLADLGRVQDLGYRVLIGASRKRFVTVRIAGKPTAAVERDPATVAVTAFVGVKGVWGVRVHDVVGNLQAAVAAGRLRRAGGRV